MDRNGFKNRMQQYKKAREENPGLKYYDFMERLAEFKAKEWNDDPDMVLQHMLNDNSYNYRQMYEDNPNFDIQEGHFVDTYKTAYHPTFSEESMYSGKKSQYNPEGIVGGSWDESTRSFYLNDRRQSRQKAQDYLNHADPGYQAIPKYDEGTDDVEEWDPRITAEGYDDKGYYARAMNPMPEITVVGSKTRARSERPMQFTYVNGYPEATTWTTDYNPGAGALEIVNPEFDLLTGVRSLPKLAFKSFDFKNNVNIGNKWNKLGSESYVQSVDDYYFKIPQKGFKGLNNNFAKEVRKKLRFNELPENTRVPYTYEGYIIDGKGHYFPVVKQKAVRQHADESINNQLFTDIQNEFKKAGYSANTKYTGAQNKWYNVQDYSPNQNIGELNGKGVLFDAILGESYVPQFIKTFKENYKLIKDRPFITGLNAVSENTENFAEGGEVEPDPLEVLERSRPKVAGISINDRPLDTYGPFEELGAATLLGGLGGVALRGLFKNYGKMTAALAFGDYGNENALVVKKPLRKGDPTVKPISTGNISEDTRDFYREYVMPLSDHLTEQEKLDFINNNANFMYNVYPESRFDEGVLGFRNKYTGEIALNEKILDDPITFGRTMAHESDHALEQVKERPRWQTYLINRNSPRTKDQKKTRAGSNSEAYATHEANKWDIVNNFEQENGRKPTLKEFQQHTDVVPAKTLSGFRNRDSYGRMYEENEIKKLAQQHLTIYDYSKWLDTNKRNTLKYVPATIPFILTTNKEES